jgi:hypothetical protein
MNNLPNFQNATPESVWVDLQESKRFLAELIAETERLRKKSSEDFELERKKSNEVFELERQKSNEVFERERQKSSEDFELERKKSYEDFERERQKSNEVFERERQKSNEDFERERQKSNDDFEHKRQKSDEVFERERKKSQKDFDRRVKKLEELVGGMGNNNGEMAEEYFYNTFRRNKTFVNETFEKVLRNRCIKNGIWDAEFDLMLLNGKSAVIIEVKYRAKHENISIEKLISRVEPFKALFPDYKNHNIYLGVAAMSFNKMLAIQLHKAGIATIHQEGRRMVVYDKELKGF